MGPKIFFINKELYKRALAQLLKLFENFQCKSQCGILLISKQFVHIPFDTHLAVTLLYKNWTRDPVVPEATFK